MRRIFLVIMVLILGAGCATTTEKLPWEDRLVLPRTGEFDKRTGIYKNNEMGFKIWFPSAYDVWVEESTLQQFAKRGMVDSDLLPILYAINERESIYVGMLAVKSSMEADDSFYLLKVALPKFPAKVISTKEKEISGAKCMEYVCATSAEASPENQEIDMTLHVYLIDVKNYKVLTMFGTLTRSYNQRRIDEINEIINSFKQF